MEHSAPRSWSPWPAVADRKVSAPRRCAILASGVGSRGEARWHCATGQRQRNPTMRTDVPRRCATGERRHRQERRDHAAQMATGQRRRRPPRREEINFAAPPCAATATRSGRAHRATSQHGQRGQQQRRRERGESLHLANGGGTKGECAALLRHHGQRRWRHDRRLHATPLRHTGQRRRRHQSGESRAAGSQWRAGKVPDVELHHPGSDVRESS